jgi:Asp-tRNA(Asn)/Glu-tRNA(Gln) amidotransferase A subunit family amidase
MHLTCPFEPGLAIGNADPGNESSKDQIGVADAVLTDLEEIAGASLGALGRGLSAGHFTACDLVGAYLARIEGLDSDFNAYCYVDGDLALEQAALSDGRRQDGAILSSLDGIPFAVADLIDVAGMPTAAGLAFRKQHVASTDAETTCCQHGC